MQSCLSKQPFGCFPHGSITGFELEFSNPVISLHLYECRASECDQRSVPNRRTAWQDDLDQRYFPFKTH